MTGSRRLQLVHGRTLQVPRTVDLGSPRVVHCKRARYHVYIGRPGLWGNPFIIGRHGDRATVIALYEHYVLNTPQLREAVGDLKGLVLGCWCHPKPCHGDVLVRLANDPLVVRKAG
jgi:Domain of unknown function (DUF4326)